MRKIAKIFSVSESIVMRSYGKHYGTRGMVANKKISKEKEQKIINLYKNNPVIKVSEVIDVIGVSSTVIGRVRRENNIQHLGYMHLVGCNNPNKENILKRTSSVKQVSL